MEESELNLRNKNKIIIILTFVFAAIIIAFLIIWQVIDFIDRNEKRIILEKDGVTIKDLEYQNMNMVPGLKKEYTLKIISKASGVYDIKLNFISDDIDGLVQYLEVEIETEQENRKYSLNNVINNEDEIMIQLTIKKKKATKIRIIYNIPNEVGNEAQGLSSNFKLTFIAKRKGK